MTVTMSRMAREADRVHANRPDGATMKLMSGRSCCLLAEVDFSIQMTQLSV